MRLIIISLLLLLLSCEIVEKKCLEYKLDDFKFCIPNTWKEQKVNVYDSKVLMFVGNKDSIFISNTDINISEDLILVNNEKEKKALQEFSNNEVSKDDIMIYKNKKFDVSHAVFDKHYYYYDKINEIDVLMVSPKKDKGTMGAFFNKNASKDKLSVYCNSPSEETKRDLQLFFKSVHYK